MTLSDARRTYLLSEIESLEPFSFIMLIPSGQPLLSVEVGRSGEGQLEVRIPSRPPGAPDLPEEARQAFEARALASEAPDDPMHPWVRAVSNAGEALDLAHDVARAAYGVSAEAPLDVIHGSRRVEHEARQKLEEVGKSIENVLARLAPAGLQRDKDGDFCIPVQNVHVIVGPRLAMGGRVVVRVLAITNVGITVTPELGILLARLNFGLAFGRFALDVENRSIWVDETLLGDYLNDDELHFTIEMVATIADEWDNRLKQMFGGSTYQEVISADSQVAVPTNKPGQGLYL